MPVRFDRIPLVSPVVLALALGSAPVPRAAAPARPAPGYPDISAFKQDLFPPAMTSEAPAPGRRVRLTLPEYAGTGVYLSLYLPTDWRAGQRYPVIVEYAGNGNYRSKHGDVSTGRVENSSLGYGLGGPAGHIWACLPYVNLAEKRNEIRWWGDIEATVDFCKQAVRWICRDFGGDADRVVICGFSRGALACNYLGLHDDEIAGLWRAFFPASHYDGVRNWDYPASDRASALRRLHRLRHRPVFVSHEVYDIKPGTYSIMDTVNYLAQTGQPLDNFTFQVVGIRNHTDTWTLHDIPERASVRRWLAEAIATRPAP